MLRFAVALVAVSVAACGRESPPPPPADRPATAPAAAVNAPGRFATPDALLKALYAEGSRPSGADNDRWFAQDVATALRADEGGDEVGAVSFDYRIDGQDGAVSDLRFEPYADGAGEAVVRARFKNEDRPVTIDWTLCLRGPDDWRIKDAKGPDWSLRGLLRLPPSDVC